MANIQDEAAVRISRRNVGATHEDKDLSCSVRRDDSDLNQEPGLFSNLRLIVYEWASLKLLGPPCLFAFILILRPSRATVDEADRPLLPGHRIESDRPLRSLQYSPRPLMKYLKRPTRRTSSVPMVYRADRRTLPASSPIAVPTQ
ncbi:hypothetical protein FIE12Z_7684 [Fusarium flagelliforme]|uniref:Uncharacterized protein n=1 Tax=Fusarium flagelliforme TaxID=2675880 RepID=A0A395MJE5_9HYPO|nr:hypothetical protein FIE12Z_7684 [Fusarium flagelliforme]